MYRACARNDSPRARLNRFRWLPRRHPQARPHRQDPRQMGAPESYERGGASPSREAAA